MKLLLALIGLPLVVSTGFAQVIGDPPMQKSVFGPDGTRRAHVGETITAIIQIRNVDDYNDSWVITNIVDAIHHAAGSVITPNLLPGPITLTNFGAFVHTTNTYVVLPGDGPMLEDDAQAGGIDNHDGDEGTYNPQQFFVTFPGQVRIFAPGISIGQSCAVTGAFGDPGAVISLTVSNIGTFNTTLTNVWLVCDNGTPGDTNDDRVLFIGTLTNGQTASISNSFTLPGHSVTNTVIARGTDELGLTVWDTNRCALELVTPVPLAAPEIVRTGYLRLAWPSEIGRAYQIQAKDRVDAPSWTDLEFVIPATATNTMADLLLTGSARFFRVVVAQ